MTESLLREKLCLLAKSLYDRGLAHGTAGNISARCGDGGLLVSPTNSSLGFLDPGQLSRFDQYGQLIGGMKPTKEMALHQAFYETRGSDTGAVIHLHCHYTVALSMMPDIDHDNLLPPLTPYPLMKFGKVKLLPYFQPGDPAMGEAIRDLKGDRSAVVLANHGPVVAASDVESAVFAVEELEAAARITLETSHRQPVMLSKQQVAMLTAAFIQ